MPDLLGFLLGIGSSIGNWFSQGSNNNAYLQGIRETNQANKEQADLAYRRSLPVNQVANLMSAGMSKPAALASLSGGGTYTAPVMQSGSQTPAPTLDFSAALERLSNAPTNVEQRKLIQAQRHDLETSTRIKEEQDKRAAQLHELDVWQRQYGKAATEKLDAAANTLLSALLDSGKDIKDFTSYEDMVRKLGLRDRKELRGLPYLSGSQLFNTVRDRFTEERARQSQENENLEQLNRNREQQNRNTLASDSHNMNIEQLNRFRAELKEYNDTKDVRIKEAKARSMRAELDEQIAALGIARNDFQAFLESLERQPDGHYNKDELRRDLSLIPETFDTIWNALFKIIPLNALSSTLLKDLIKIGA